LGAGTATPHKKENKQYKRTRRATRIATHDKLSYSAPVFVALRLRCCPRDVMVVRKWLKVVFGVVSVLLLGAFSLSRSTNQTLRATSFVGGSGVEQNAPAEVSAPSSASAQGEAAADAADSSPEVDLGSEGDLPQSQTLQPAPALLLDEPQDFGVMLDAGSTGTRVRVYRWRLRLKAAHMTSANAAPSPFSSVVAPQPPISRPRTQVSRIFLRCGFFDKKHPRGVLISSFVRLSRRPTGA
jgi:hypothetical protein